MFSSSSNCNPLTGTAAHALLQNTVVVAQRETGQCVPIWDIYVYMRACGALLCFSAHFVSLYAPAYCVCLWVVLFRRFHQVYMRLSPLRRARFCHQVRRSPLFGVVVAISSSSA